MASQRRFKVLTHYRKPSELRASHNRQYQPADIKAYQKLTPDMIYDLLENADKHHNATSASNRLGSGTLLERMSNELWTCTATAHELGVGGPNRRADPYVHFNIWFQSTPRHFHARCRELPGGRLLVFQITF